MDGAHLHDHGHGCECEHQHDHGHTHEHGHVHAHAHDHGPAHAESFAVEGAAVSLEAHVHEQAATVSLAIRPEAGAPFAFGRLVDAMRAIAEAAEEHGSIIGHIKASAREGGAFAHASVTAADLAPTGEGPLDALFGPGADIQLAAIVVLIDLQDLVDICKSAL